MKLVPILLILFSTSAAWADSAVPRAARAKTSDGFPEGYDPVVVEFVNRAGITSTSTRRKFQNFTVQMKSQCPTLWGRLMLVPCRTGEGYLLPFGPGTALFPTGNEPFVEGGQVSRSAAGAGISFAPNWANRIEVPRGITNYNLQLAPLEPLFIATVGRNSAPAPHYFQNVNCFIRWNGGTTSDWMTTYSGWASDYGIGPYHVGMAVQGSWGAEYRQDCLAVNDSNHVSHLVGMDIQSGRKRLVLLTDNYLSDLSSATAVPSTNAWTGLWFYPGIAPSGASSGTMQYLVWFIGGISDAQQEARRVWPILQSTLMRDDNAGGRTFHIIEGGQSLATTNGLIDLQRKLNADGHGVTLAIHSFGGTPIDRWLGKDPDHPVRESQYTSGFFDAVNGTAACQISFPFGVPGVEKWVLWRQGESDTESRAASLVYGRQLDNLFAFLKEDFGNDLRMAVNLVDYSLAYRTNPDLGDFVLSGITGMFPGVNGRYRITQVNSSLDPVNRGRVTNADSPYVWTNGGTVIRRNGQQWEIRSAGRLCARSVGKQVDHPELVGRWMMFRGLKGGPVFSESRTGNIEILRQQQKSFALRNPKSVVVHDSRGVARRHEDPLAVDYQAIDAVHPNVNGEKVMSDRCKAAMFTLPAL